MEPDYTLIRSKKRRKTMSITVNREGQVAVRVPYGTPLLEIEAFVQQKRSWLNRTITGLKASPALLAPDFFMAERQLPYLGDSYPLYIEQPVGLAAENALCWSGSAFYLTCREPSSGKNLLVCWYARQAQAFLPGRVAQHAERMGVYPKNVRISSARFRWGSCSARQSISVSWRLMMAPVSVIDSVIIHELAHLREMNHSPRFWSFVRSYCPEYDQCKKWLKTEGRYLIAF